MVSFCAVQADLILHLDALASLGKPFVSRALEQILETPVQANAKTGKLEQPTKAKGTPVRDAVVNIIVPSIILMKLSKPELLGPLWAFALALVIPFSYGIVSAVQEKKLNWISALGLFNILTSGALRYFEVGRIGFAFKEALTPAIIGLAVVISLKSENPLVSKMLYNEQVLNLDKINSILTEKNEFPNLQKLLVQTTWMLAASFFLSSFMNFSLALWFLKSPVNSVEFNQELGRMTAMSWPMIVLPCMLVMGFSLWHLGSGIRRLTGLDWENVLKVESEKSK
jgi:hypothetical protein